MTPDDYQQMRGMYADVDELCQGVEGAGSAEASDESLRRLVALFHGQQREPEQIRSFVRHLGVTDEVIRRVLGEAAPAEESEGGPGIT
jgi:hypothetical protein